MVLSAAQFKHKNYINAGIKYILAKEKCLNRVCFFKHCLNKHMSKQSVHGTATLWINVSINVRCNYNKRSGGM